MDEITLLLIDMGSGRAGVEVHVDLLKSLRLCDKSLYRKKELLL